MASLFLWEALSVNGRHLFLHCIPGHHRRSVFELTRKNIHNSSSCPGSIFFGVFNICSQCRGVQEKFWERKTHALDLNFGMNIFVHNDNVLMRRGWVFLTKRRGIFGCTIPSSTIANHPFLWMLYPGLSFGVQFGLAMVDKSQECISNLRRRHHQRLSIIQIYPAFIYQAFVSETVSVHCGSIPAVALAFPMFKALPIDCGFSNWKTHTLSEMKSLIPL